MAPKILISTFLIDEDNEREMARHGVTEREVLQLLDERYTVLRNRRDRSGTHLLIGRTRAGRALTVPIAPGFMAGDWRPITAWDSTDPEKARLE
jgi:hypothetical protein